MAFQVSPGINVSEVDLSTTIPNVSVSDAAIAAAFQWGPAESVTTVTSEVSLVDTFGKPDANTVTNWLTASSFLSYAGSLQVVRTLQTSGALNSNDESTTGGFVSGGGITGTPVVNASGTGYVVDETFNIGTPGAGGTQATGKVTSINSGTVTGVEVVNAGSNYTAGNGITTSGASANGDDALTLNITVAAIVADSTGILVKNEAEYDAGITFDTDSTFVARYPGAIGNSIGVGLIHKGSATTLNIGTTTHTWGDLFDSLPNFRSGNPDNLVHVFVTDSGGLFTGTKGEVLERFSYVSICSDAKDAQGNSNYIVDVIRNQSKYIYCTGKFDANANFGAAEGDITNWDSATVAAATVPEDLTTHYTAVLSGGVSDNSSSGANTTGARQTGYGFFADAEQTDVSIFLIGEEPDTTAYSLTDYVIGTVIGARKDAVAFTSPALSTVQTAGTLATKATNVVADRDKVTSSSYGVMDSSWKRMYNKYTDKFVAVPLNGDTAGLCVQTDNSADTWYSPAGFNRGQIKNAASLYLDPDKTARDVLYKGGVNPVASFPGSGIILFGDKTLQATPSAFDRINVRRLFIVLEKTISRAARSMLFEFNEEFTRAQFRSMIDPFLRNIKSRRGIIDYTVVCDTTNNTADVIDRNEFVGDIFVKPARSINFIQLNFVAVSTGVSFEEVVGAV